MTPRRRPSSGRFLRQKLWSSKLWSWSMRQDQSFWDCQSFWQEARTWVVFDHKSRHKISCQNFGRAHVRSDCRVYLCHPVSSNRHIRVIKTYCTPILFMRVRFPCFLFKIYSKLFCVSHTLAHPVTHAEGSNCLSAVPARRSRALSSQHIVLCS